MIKFRIKNFKTIVIFLLLVNFNQTCYAHSLQELDRIITQAPNLNSFLNNPTLIRQYTEALKQYYGDQITETSVGDILTQLRDVNSKVPSFAARMWETIPATRGFETPREVTPTLSLKFEGESQDITRFATKGPFFQMRKITLTTITGPQWLAEKEEELAREFTELERQIAPLNKREKNRITGEYLARLKKNPDYYELAKKKFQEPLISMFSYLDGTQVGVNTFFKKLDQLKASPNTYFKINNNNLSFKLLSSILKEKLPNSTKIVAEYSQHFPQQDVNKKIISFRPIPRRIHGIWKGLPLKECVGGGSCAGTTPERWATIALKDSEIYR